MSNEYREKRAMLLWWQAQIKLANEMMLSLGPSHDYDLGSWILDSSSLPNSNQTFCMLNRQGEVTLLRPTATPTATSSA